MGPTISEFVTARVAEWEKAAQIDLRSESWGSTYDDGGELSVILTPPRVLAQCAAMRLIVERCDNYNGEDGWLTLESVVRALASIWSDHPDWREEWRA